LLAQNRVGSKFGGGGVAGASESNIDRRERLRKLALETIDLAKVSALVLMVHNLTTKLFFRILIFLEIIWALWNVVYA
jgi:hypothetical protein